MKTKLILIALVALAALFAGACGEATNKTSQHTTHSQNTSSEASQSSRVPAFVRDLAGLRALRPTLPPENFIGPARQAYQVAREIPETLAQLPCYCHCDINMGHKSLHSCFEDNHASQCAVCVSEALQAASLQKSGLTPEQIRDRIILEYTLQ